MTRQCCGMLKGLKRGPRYYIDIMIHDGPGLPPIRTGMLNAMEETTLAQFRQIIRKYCVWLPEDDDFMFFCSVENCPVAIKSEGEYSASYLQDNVLMILVKRTYMKYLLSTQMKRKQTEFS